MRLALILFISVGLASAAGCFGKDDDPPATTPTPPTGTGTTPTGGTTATTPTSPTAGNNNTPPAKPAPRDVHTGSATFQNPPPVPPDPTNPGGPPVDTPFTVPALYTTLTLNVTWSLGAAPIGAAATELRIEIVDPAGAPIGTPCIAPAGPHPAAPAVCSQPTTIPATGGQYVLRTSGEGTLTAAVTVNAS